MDFNLNWIDLVIIFLILFFIIEAIGRSFLLEVLDLVSFILALILSFRFYNDVSKIFESQFQLPHGLSLVIGFMASWFITEIIFYFLARAILPKIHLFKIPYSKFLSIIPAILRSLIFISIILVLIATFPVQPNIKKAVNDSKIGSVLLSKAYKLEQPIKQVFGGLSQESLTFLTIKPKTNEKVNLGFQTKEFKVDPATEESMIVLVNKERTSRGLNALIFDEKLRETGRMHSKDMFERGYFAHYSPEGESVADRASKQGADFLVIGENLAFAPNLELAHNGLMNSEGHRANILSSDFGKIGIGVIDGGIYGKMFTQVFTN